MKSIILALSLIGALAFSSASAAADSDLDKRVEHGYADSNGVKVHYASLGKGPLIVMIHGFPDYSKYAFPSGKTFILPRAQYKVVACPFNSTSDPGFEVCHAFQDGV